MNQLQNFICFLVDTAEGDTISEEYLLMKLSQFLKSKYKDNKSFPALWRKNGKCQHSQKD